MRPSGCAECRDHFMASPLLQAEARHHAAKYGAGSAESWLNEKLEDFHDDHLESEFWTVGEMQDYIGNLHS